MYGSLVLLSRCGTGCDAGWARGADSPTDPLSIKEIHETVEVLRAARKTNDSSRYSLITLREPPKGVVRAFHRSARFDRQAFAVVFDRVANQTFEAVVDLTHLSLLSWTQVPGTQPAYLLDDSTLLEQAVRADPHFPEIMRRHGVTDVSHVGIGDWPGGYYEIPEDTGYRYRRADFSYLINRPLCVVCVYDLVIRGLS